MPSSPNEMPATSPIKLKTEVDEAGIIVYVHTVNVSLSLYRCVTVKTHPVWKVLTHRLINPGTKR